MFSTNVLILNFVCLKVQQRHLGVTGRIFAIDTVRARGGGPRATQMKLKVNFQPDVITLAKEVKRLISSINVIV